jgi:serine protease Do
MNNLENDPWDIDDRHKEDDGPKEHTQGTPVSGDDGGNDGRQEQGTPSSPANGGAAPGSEPQNGYSPYGNPNGGQYPPYSPYQPYGRYDNPYPAPGGQQPYWNPYGQTPQPPHKMGGGLKAFLWVLGVVAAGLLISFLYFSFHTDLLENGAASSSPQTYEGASSSPASGFNGTIPKDSASSSAGTSSVIGGVNGDGTSKNSSGISIAKKPSSPALSAAEVYQKVIQSVVGVETTVSATTTGESETGEGTGIVATSDGYILTNAHVVNYSRNNAVKVVMHDNKTYQATVVGFDKTSDLAVLKINATGLSPATFGSVDEMQIGEQVVAIGNPGGLTFAGSITGGMISALNRTIASHSDNGMTYIQTDAAINPGNSGGPLVNMHAQVIGINSNKIFATGYEGMGFAIPLSKAQTIINQLIRNGYVSGRTRLGIKVQEIESARASLYGVPSGIIIRSIDSDSDMIRAGAQVGDIITEADGKKITGTDDLYAVLDDHKPGDTISMKIYTGAITGSGTTKTIRVKLLEDKGQTQQ